MLLCGNGLGDLYEHDDTVKSRTTFIAVLARYPMRSRAAVTREQMPALTQMREGWSARGDHVLETGELKHTDEHAIPSSTEHNGCRK
jgi:hypothetical protein